MNKITNLFKKIFNTTLPNNDTSLIRRSLLIAIFSSMIIKVLPLVKPKYRDGIDSIWLLLPKDY